MVVGWFTYEQPAAVFPEATIVRKMCFDYLPYFFFDYLGVMNIRTKFHAFITICTTLIIPCASGMDCTIVTSQNAKVGIDSKIAETVILSANTTPQRHMGGNMSLKRLHYLVSLTGFQS